MEQNKNQNKDQSGQRGFGSLDEDQQRDSSRQTGQTSQTSDRVNQERNVSEQDLQNQ